MPPLPRDRPPLHEVIKQRLFPEGAPVEPPAPTDAELLAAAQAQDAAVLERTREIFRPDIRRERARARQEERMAELTGAAEKPKRMTDREGAEKLRDYLRSIPEERRETWLSVLDESRYGDDDSIEVPDYSLWPDDEDDPNALRDVLSGADDDYPEGGY